MHEDHSGNIAANQPTLTRASSPASVPIMGMLVWPSRITRLLDGQPVPSMELAAEAARQVGVGLYFFRTRDVDLRTRRIHGWQQQVDGSWTQTEMPWPDVFHPAIEIRKQRGRRIRDVMSKTAQLVNLHDVLDKWEVHQALSSFQEMRPYLPETVLYKHPSDLREMLQRHQSVLAKPCIGLGAMHISKVWAMGDETYGWEDSSTGLRETEINFQRVLEKVTGNASGPFIVQQELRILESDQQRNKVRVIMNKDGSGSWRHAVTYAFIGEAGQFAVSRHQGAEQMTLHQGLTAMGVSDKLEAALMYQLAKVALMTVTCLDRVLGPMGEIGLDLAIGQGDQVWLIEANARPNKDNLPFSDQWSLLRPFLLMMQYARYLWLQGETHPQKPVPPEEHNDQQTQEDEAPGEPIAPIAAQPAHPVMAVFLNRKTIDSLAHAPVKEAIHYAQAARSRDICAYFCSVDDIKPTSRTVRGWAQEPDGSWEKSVMPWPDYFYDQAKDMPKAERAEADALRRVLPSMVQPINTLRFLDKWWLYRKLTRYPWVSSLLPDTSICSHPEQLASMLQRHSKLIVKPTNSSRGRGISLITRTARRRYAVQPAKGKAANNLTLQQAFKLILEKANRERVLLQRYLELLEIDGRLFDLRLLMGKDSQGKWRVVSPRMRLGRRNSFITNTNQGADRLPLMENLRKAMSQRDADRLYARAESLAIGICQYIERVVGPMGEIGLDFIVDRNRRLWFIEGNPQPGKAPMPHEAAAAEPLLYSHVMDYCRYLWEQQGK